MAIGIDFFGTNITEIDFGSAPVVKVDFGSTTVFPSIPATRLAVTESLTRLIPVEVEYAEDVTLPAGQWNVTNNTEFSTASILPVGSAWTGVIRVFVSTVDVPAGFTSQSVDGHALIWSSADNWMVFAFGNSIGAVGSSFYWNGTVESSSGVIQPDAAIYLGDAIAWPQVDDGTLPDVHIPPPVPANRGEVVAAMMRATTAELTYLIGDITPAAGFYNLANATTLSTAPIQTVGSAFNTAVVCYLGVGELPITNVSDNLLVWTNGDNWAIYNLTFIGGIGSSTRMFINLLSSAGTIQSSAALYWGDTTHWPAVDDGTLPDV